MPHVKPRRSRSSARVMIHCRPISRSSAGPVIPSATSPPISRVTPGCKRMVRTGAPRPRRRWSMSTPIIRSISAACSARFSTTRAATILRIQPSCRPAWSSSRSRRLHHRLLLWPAEGPSLSRRCGYGSAPRPKPRRHYSQRPQLLHPGRHCAARSSAVLDQRATHAGSHALRVRAGIARALSAPGHHLHLDSDERHALADATGLVDQHEHGAGRYRDRGERSSASGKLDIGQHGERTDQF